MSEANKFLPQKFNDNIELIRAQNANLLQQNFQLTQKLGKLESDYRLLQTNYQNLVDHIKELEEDYEKESLRCQSTIDNLKEIIKNTDTDYKNSQSELKLLKMRLEKDETNEKTIEQLKENINKAEEEKEIETEAIKEQIELLLEELRESRHEKEELESHNKMYQDEIKKYKETIVELRKELDKCKYQQNNNHFVEDSHELKAEKDEHEGNKGEEILDEWYKKRMERREDMLKFKKSYNDVLAHTQLKDYVKKKANNI